MGRKEIIMIKWNWFDNSWWKIKITMVSNWEKQWNVNRKKK